MSSEDEINVTTFFSPSLFWFIYCKDFEIRRKLTDKLKEYNIDDDKRITEPEIGQVVLVRYNGEFARAKVELINNSTKKITYTCFLLDFGVFQEAKYVYKIPEEIKEPQICKKGVIYGVRSCREDYNLPKGYYKKEPIDEWTIAVPSFCKRKLERGILTFKDKYESCGLVVGDIVILSDGKTLEFSKELVSNGHAIFDEPAFLIATMNNVKNYSPAPIRTIIEQSIKFTPISQAKEFDVVKGIGRATGRNSSESSAANECMKRSSSINQTINSSKSFDNDSIQDKPHSTPTEKEEKRHKSGQTHTSIGDAICLSYGRGKKKNAPSSDDDTSTSSSGIGNTRTKNLSSKSKLSESKLSENDECEILNKDFLRQMQISVEEDLSESEKRRSNKASKSNNNIGSIKSDIDECAGGDGFGRQPGQNQTKICGRGIYRKESKNEPRSTTRVSDDELKTSSGGLGQVDKKTIGQKKSKNESTFSDEEFDESFNFSGRGRKNLESINTNSGGFSGNPGIGRGFSITGKSCSPAGSISSSSNLSENSGKTNISRGRAAFIQNVRQAKAQKIGQSSIKNVETAPKTLKTVSKVRQSSIKDVFDDVETTPKTLKTESKVGQSPMKNVGTILKTINVSKVSEKDAKDASEDLNTEEEKDSPFKRRDFKQRLTDVTPSGRVIVNDSEVIKKKIYEIGKSADTTLGLNNPEISDILRDISPNTKRAIYQRSKSVSGRKQENTKVDTEIREKRARSHHRSENSTYDQEKTYSHERKFDNEEESQNSGHRSRSLYRRPYINKYDPNYRSRPENSGNYNRSKQDFANYPGNRQNTENYSHQHPKPENSGNYNRNITNPSRQDSGKYAGNRQNIENDSRQHSKVENSGNYNRNDQNSGNRYNEYFHNMPDVQEQQGSISIRHFMKTKDTSRLNRHNKSDSSVNPEKHDSRLNTSSGSYKNRQDTDSQPEKNDRRFLGNRNNTGLGPITGTDTSNRYSTDSNREHRNIRSEAGNSTNRYSDSPLTNIKYLWNRENTNKEFVLASTDYQRSPVDYDANRKNIDLRQSRSTNRPGISDSDKVSANRESIGSQSKNLEFKLDTLGRSTNRPDISDTKLFANRQNTGSHLEPANQRPGSAASNYSNRQNSASRRDRSTDRRDSDSANRKNTDSRHDVPENKPEPDSATSNYSNRPDITDFSNRQNTYSRGDRSTKRDNSDHNYPTNRHITGLRQELEDSPGSNNSANPKNTGSKNYSSHGLPTDRPEKYRGYPTNRPDSNFSANRHNTDSHSKDNSNRENTNLGEKYGHRSRSLTRDEQNSDNREITDSQLEDNSDFFAKPLNTGSNELYNRQRSKSKNRIVKSDSHRSWTGFKNKKPLQRSELFGSADDLSEPDQSSQDSPSSRRSDASGTSCQRSESNYGKNKKGRCTCERCVKWFDNSNVFEPHKERSKLEPKSQENRNKYLLFKPDDAEKKDFDFKIKSNTIDDVNDLKNVVAPRLLVHGCLVPSPVNEIYNVPFHTDVMKVLRELKYEKVYKVQKFAWTAMLRGHHVVIINGKEQGKTMVYVPVLSSLAMNGFCNRNSELGPVSLVLCPGVEIAEKVHKLMVKMFMYSKSRVKITLAVSPLTSELKADIQKGLDILICTPRGLHTLLREKRTRLRRISHVVLENADEILEKFPLEIKLLQDYLQKLSSKPSMESSSIQITMLSEKWSPLIENLVKRLRREPLICIGAHLEAAFYGKADIRVKFIKSSEKPAEVIDIINQKKNYYKTIVVCNKIEETAEVVKYVDANGIKYMVLHNASTQDTIRSVYKRWNKTVGGKHFILICTDHILRSEMCILDAQVVIQYSLPDSWTSFVFRFSTFTDNYWCTVAKQNESTIVCKMFLFVDETSQNQFPKIFQLLKRVGAKVSQTLEEAYRESLKATELKKQNSNIEICPKLKLFGLCPLMETHNCDFRHTFKSTDISDTIPKSGIIKCRNLLVCDVTSFYAILVEHTDAEGVVRPIENKYAEISTYLTKLTDDDEREIVVDIKIGGYYACETNAELYRRCEVVEIVKVGTLHKAMVVRVRLIDTGKEVVVSTNKIFVLPKELKNIPPQAVKIHIANIGPPDKDTTFPNGCKIKLIKELTNAGYEEPVTFFTGRIIFQLDNTLWVDNLTLKEKLSYDSLEIHKLSIKATLLKKNLAESRPNQMEKLYNAYIEMGATLPDYTQPVLKAPKPARPQQTPMWAHLENGEEYNLVHLICAETPESFYVRLDKHLDSFNQLERDIKAAISKPFYQDDFEVTVGKCYLAKDPQSESYARVLVMSITEGNAEVFFVDFGDKADIPISELKYLTDDLILKLPFQVIECSLAGIHSTDEYWTQEAIDVLYDFTFIPDKMNIFRTLHVKFLEREEPTIAKSNKYSVILLDVFVEEVIVNNIFVAKGLAGRTAEIQVDMEEIKGKFVVKKKEESDDEMSEEELKKWKSGDVELTQEFSNSTSDNEMDKWDFQLNDPLEFLSGLLNKPIEQLMSSESQVKDESTFNGLSTSFNQAPNNLNQIKNIKALPDPGYSTPNVVWKQTDSQIILTVQLTNVNDYNCSVIHHQRLSFMTQSRDILYKLNLKLFEKVSNNIKHTARGLDVLIKLEKEVEGEWPRLVESEEKLRYITYDVATLANDDSEDENILVKIQKAKEILNKEEEKEEKDGNFVYQIGSDEDYDVSDLDSGTSDD